MYIFHHRSTYSDLFCQKNNSYSSIITFHKYGAYRAESLSLTINFYTNQRFSSVLSYTFFVSSPHRFSLEFQSGDLESPIRTKKIAVFVSRHLFEEIIAECQKMTKTDLYNHDHRTRIIFISGKSII